MTEIINLGIVKGTDYERVRKFYEKLSRCYDALQTLDRKDILSGLVMTTISKLPNIKPDLVRTDDEWEEWSMKDLVENLEKWHRRNKPRETSFANEERHKREQYWYSGEAKEKPLRKCIYCELDHWSDTCKKLETIDSRSFFRENKRCFNYGKKGHRGDKCLKRGCCFCKAKHHSSLHDKEKDGNGSVLTGFTSSVEETLPQLLPVRIEGKVIWAFHDTG